MMSRTMVLVFLLLMLVVTSQFEWKQQLVNELHTSPSISQKQQQQQQASNRKEVLKEKMILSQEKNIQRLNELVCTLREQLQQCRGNNYPINGTVTLTANVNELEQQHILEE